MKLTFREPHLLFLLSLHDESGKLFLALVKAFSFFALYVRKFPGVRRQLMDRFTQYKYERGAETWQLPSGKYHRGNDCPAYVKIDQNFHMVWYQGGEEYRSGGKPSMIRQRNDFLEDYTIKWNKDRLVTSYWYEIILTDRRPDNPLAKYDIFKFGGLNRVVLKRNDEWMFQKKVKEVDEEMYAIIEEAREDYQWPNFGCGDYQGLPVFATSINFLIVSSGMTQLFM